MVDFLAFSQGFALGLGLFMCPGPKDIVMLRQALCRRPTVELLTVGVGSDALLIALGISGVSTALHRVPQAEELALWIGVGLMLWHGAHAVWRLAVRSLNEEREEDVRNDRTALLLVSFLNPVAWMDTVLVIGTAGAMLPKLSQPSYGFGAVTASTAWFLLLTLGARRAAPWIARPSTRWVLDAVAAVAMLAMAGCVAKGLL